MAYNKWHTRIFHLQNVKTFSLCLIIFVVIDFFIYHDQTDKLTAHAVPMDDAELMKRAGSHDNITEDFLEMRRALLYNTSIRKVIILAYMRGGSSLVADIFSQDSEVTLWYEPLAPFFTYYYGLGYARKTHPVLHHDNMSRIQYSTGEQKLIVKYMENLLSCELDLLPVTTWLHSFTGHSHKLRPIKKCVRRNSPHKTLKDCCTMGTSPCGDFDFSRSKRCPDILDKGRSLVVSNKSITMPDLASALGKFVEMNNIPSSLLKKVHKISEQILCIESVKRQTVKCLYQGMRNCHGGDLRVIKADRLKMEEIGPIITTTPDVFVFHYVRDPRGIIYSRSRIPGAHLMLDEVTNDIIKEAEFICNQMRYDLEQRQFLETLYPGTILQVRYEDLVTNQHEILSYMYNHIGKRAPETNNSTAYSQSKVSSEKENPFNTNRANVTSSIYKWKTGFSEDELIKINKICGDVLQKLGYSVT